MDRMQAKEKINKLLRLVNDKGATASEKETALEMANKIAAKFGFKIQKGNPATAAPAYNKPAVYTYQFDLGCFNKKLVGLLLECLGINNWILVGKKTVTFSDCRKFDVIAFQKFYKKFHPVYNGLRKEVDMSAAEYFDTFKYYFMTGVNNQTVFGKFRPVHILGYQFGNTKFFQ